MTNEPFVLRLTGRPEIERSLWLSTAAIRKIGHVTVITRDGPKQCVPTGHREDGTDVWVPHDRVTDWPPKHGLLTEILTDHEEEDFDS